MTADMKSHISKEVGRSVTTELKKKLPKPSKRLRSPSVGKGRGAKRTRTTAGMDEETTIEDDDEALVSNSVAILIAN